MTAAAPILFAIYATVVWTGPARHIPCPKNNVCWHEFIMTQHNPLYGDNSYATNDEHWPVWFLSQAVCEQYRVKFVHYWINRDSVPFRNSELASSRCGNWYDNPIGLETSDEL